MESLSDKRYVPVPKLDLGLARSLTRTYMRIAKEQLKIERGRRTPGIGAGAMYRGWRAPGKRYVMTKFVKI